MLTIDTHQHVFPEAYRKMLDDTGRMTGGIGEAPKWSPTLALEFMDRFEIGTGMLSTPVPSFGSVKDASYWARSVNEAGAAAVASSPSRFGYLATIPMADMDSALEETRYAFDVLHADGVVLMASTGGVYLGDASLTPLMEELNTRSAVIFVHPGDLPGPAVPTIPPFAADFLLDTTRAAINLILAHTLDECPNLRIILAHAGGFLPYIIYRILPMLAGGNIDRTDEVLAGLKRFYFDLALSSSPTALPSLLAFADHTHITFGSDWPAAPEDVVRFFGNEFEKYPFDPDLRYAIGRGNAERLFPRLGAAG